MQKEVVFAAVEVDAEGLVDEDEGASLPATSGRARAGRHLPPTIAVT